MLFSAFSAEQRKTDISQIWPNLQVPALDPKVEKRVEECLSKLTLEQKVGQIIQADSDSVTPEEVKEFRLGAVLSGGNSAPGELPYAGASEWLQLADAYFKASVDIEGVEVAIPVMWGIDAVHGHSNLYGATVYPHNIGLGATRNPDLVENIMKATASDLIVSGHDWTFAPTLAVPRDDRWGRTYEGFSEDPEIVASFADSIVWGLQGRPNTKGFFDQTRVISCAKHFIGDGGTVDGIDQGDTALSEEELASIHAAAYYPALEAGVQTVMVSFSSWNGMKMHGHKYMLTDVLKGRLGFNGFVIGDWNGHGQIPGCTNTDCPDALLAGVDMYMAPDSWKGLYHSLLENIQTGLIPMERLDDAVRRILRVKFTSGLFEKPCPSKRLNAGDYRKLASFEQRKIARQSVRESIVLLKNNDQTLPLRTNQRVLVIGDGADNVSKQCGGWTLSWQGTGNTNGDFPNAHSILEGIQDAVKAGGGEVIFQHSLRTAEEVDVVIAVYGEEPYAEFKGDLDHLEFRPNNFDTAQLAGFRALGIPVVSVFLSGRPLWTNPQINQSDAFVAAWLPGSEGAGIADVLFQLDPTYDFVGRLSFSWPATAIDFDNNLGKADYSPLFPVGYGLSYATHSENMPMLSETSGLDQLKPVNFGQVFNRGVVAHPWNTVLVAEGERNQFFTTSASYKGLSVSYTDYITQEDAFLIDFKGGNLKLLFELSKKRSNGNDISASGKSLAFAVKSNNVLELNIELESSDSPQTSILDEISSTNGQWMEVAIPMECLSGNLSRDSKFLGFSFSTKSSATIELANIRFLENEEVDN